MKRLPFLFILIAAVLSSCCKKENETLLYKLDSIKAMGDTLPREAMRSLDSIKPLFAEETEYMQNKLALLEIRLRDKAYITHTSADTIKNLCSYFDKSGTDKERQEAYYYMGSVYRDLNDYPNAIVGFLKSASVAENSINIDAAIWENSYSQLSHIYRQQLNYNDALNVILKGVSVAEKFGVADARTYMNVASSYSELNDTIRMVEYIKQALIFIEKNESPENYLDIVATAMGDYSMLGYNKEATYCYNILKSCPEDLKPFNYFINLTYYFANFVSVDSAANVMVKLYNTTNNLDMKYDAARWLTIYYSYEDKNKLAAEYAVNFIEANDEVIAKRKFEHTTNANNFFQYQRDKEEELMIMQEAAQWKQNLIMVISVSVFLFLVCVVFYFYRKKRLLDIILRKEDCIDQARALIDKKDAELAVEKVEIERKQKELEMVTAINNRLSSQLVDAEEDFKMLVEQNRELTKLTIMSDISADSNDIIEKVKKASKGKHHLNDEEWKELLGAIDKLYPEFGYDVQANFKKIKEPMLRVCYLLRIGLSGPEIVNLTDYPRQTVWDRIKRIEKVMPAIVSGHRATVHRA